nr:hypothetical protein [Dyella sp. ASV24]
MGNYAVFLEGNNFWLSNEGRGSLSGFFMTKRVEARDSDEAGQLAIRDLWLHPELAGQEKNTPTPSIEVKVVHELPDSIKMKDTELAIYPMDEE